MTTECVIQLGHCFRRRGFTGTEGLYNGRTRTEQEFVSTVGYRMAELLTLRGVTNRVVLADDPVPASTVFVALHQDGSENRSARGASVGYPNVGGERLGQIFKALYQLGGWPSGYRPDNYTRALRNYYGFRRSSAPAKLLIEHGFATNTDDQRWMWSNWERIAQINAEAVTRYLGPTTTDDDDEGITDMETLIDSTTGEAWVAANGKARPLSNVADWLATWTGPLRRSANMRFVIGDLYEVLE